MQYQSDNFDDNKNYIFKYLYLPSVQDKQTIKLIHFFIDGVINNFKIRYLATENDYELIYENVLRIELYNYIYDEFTHLLFSETFEPILDSGISMQDVDKIYITIVDIIEFLLYDDESDYNDDNF